MRKLFTMWLDVSLRKKIFGHVKKFHYHSAAQVFEEGARELIERDEEQARVKKEKVDVA